MTHKRQIIRHAIGTLLKQHAPAFDGKVYLNRSRPTEMTELPVALVYSLSETAANFTIDGYQHRGLTVIVEIRVRLVTGSDDLIDALCLEVEQAIALDPRLGGVANLVDIASTQIGIDGDGETRQMLASLTYTVQYETGPTGD